MRVIKKLKMHSHPSNLKWDAEVLSAGCFANSQTVSMQDIDNLLMIQRFLPKLKIRDVRIVNGYWEALVTLKYPIDGSCTNWYKVKDLIEEFKGGTR